MLKRSKTFYKAANGDIYDKPHYAVSDDSLGIVEVGHATSKSNVKNTLFVIAVDTAWAIKMSKRIEARQVCRSFSDKRVIEIIQGKE